jgi:hypothetical protein
MINHLAHTETLPPGPAFCGAPTGNLVNIELAKSFIPLRFMKREDFRDACWECFISIDENRVWWDEWKPYRDKEATRGAP